MSGIGIVAACHKVKDSVPENGKSIVENMSLTALTACTMFKVNV